MRKITIIDMAVLIAVTIALVVLVSKTGALGGSVEVSSDDVNMIPASIVIRVQNVRRFTVDAFKEGDILLSNETNHPVGPIKAIESGPFRDKIEMLDGRLVMAEVPERYVVFVTVETMLLERERGYFSDGITEIKVNSEFKLYTKYLATTGIIEEIIYQ